MTFKAIHVVSGLDPSNGGPSYSVRRLLRSLGTHGVEAWGYTVFERPTPPEQLIEAFLQSYRSLPVLRELRLSASLNQALREAASSVDIIHSHGLWLMPNVYAGRAARAAGKTLVVSPRGMLAPEALDFSRFRKELFWRLLQGPAYARTALWHATSQDEADDIRAFVPAAAVAVIPNGIDMTEFQALHDPAKPEKIVLFLSRLHPKKNLRGLIEAWGRVAPDYPGWHLKIVGPDERGHLATLRGLVASRAVPRLSFVEPVYGVEKEALVAAADLFVLPTLNENFGIAVAEALAAGVPAIVTKGAPWSGLETERCGWWIDHGVEPLVVALREAMALPSRERKLMGQRGRALMDRDYGWDAIGRDMSEVYRWVVGRADRPSCVIYS